MKSEITDFEEFCFF